MYDLIIAGAGPAGLSAGIYACRGGLKTLIIEKAFAGGQMAISHIVENYPGFEKEQTGAGLAHSMKLQAVKMGAEIITSEIQSFDFSAKIKRVHTAKNVYESHTLILAMGAVPKKLGIVQENNYFGAGLSYCATCDGAFFKNKDVCVIGGGNTALEDALYLSKFCTKVYLIHRRDEYRGHKALVDAVAKLPNVIQLLDSEVTDIYGKNIVEGVVCLNKKTNQSTNIDLQGIFIGVGRQPQTELIKGQINLAEDFSIDAKEDCKTNIAGVFCAGDIRNKELRQIVTAVADGAIAATHAENYCLTNCPNS